MIFLLYFAHVSWAQTKTVFDRNGRIAPSGLSPTVYKTGSTVCFDVSGIHVPVSAFSKSVNSLIDSLHNYSGEFSEWYSEIYRHPGSLTDKLADNSVLRYNKHDFFPFSVSGPGDAASKAIVLNSSEQSVSSLTVADDDNSYRVVRYNFDNEILTKHLAETYKHYRGLPVNSRLLVDTLRTIARTGITRAEYYLYLDSLENRKEGGISSFNHELISEISGFYPKLIQGGILYHNVIETNKPWIMSWLWLTRGVPRLNPFPVFNPEPALQRTELQRQLIEKELSLISQTASCCLARTKPDESLLARSAELTERLVMLGRQGKTYSDLTPVYKQWLNEVSRDKTVLYSGNFAGSSAKKIRWIYSHDANSDFKLISDPEQIPKAIFMDDEVVVVAQNVAARDSVSLTSIEAAHKAETEFAQATGAFSGALTAAFSAGTPAGLVGLLSSVVPGSSASDKSALMKPKLSAINIASRKKLQTKFKDSISNWNKEGKISDEGSYDLSESLRRKEINESLLISNLTYSNREEIIGFILQSRQDMKPSEPLPFADSLNKLLFTDKSNFVKLLYEWYKVADIVAYGEVVQDFIDNREKVIWLIDQTDPVSEIKRGPVLPALYSSVVSYPEARLEMASSKKVTYELFVNNGKQSAVRKSFTKYALSRWLPTVGITYVSGDRSGTVFNDSSGTFRPGQNFDNFEILAGVKFYFKKTNSTRDRATSRLIRKELGADVNVSRGNGFATSLFASGGLGVRHKFLRNYYLGLGGDVIPGLGLIAGFNFIFQKRYQLENSAVKNTIDRPRPYAFFGLSFDPVIVTNLINIFK
ncbi:hypothetical protein [Dyadobacter sp. CY312]|uniref:hypothetical protein n=1 Tax=Dyadobacter sp. CY312 TaxID=2907303 RepID=UPI001F1B1C4C|nr:hypothetical protein [Dyadobacter sp. CY312]MCE7044059.1 hypothetical protein [Dyadobacter sp. CY312]